MIVRQAKQEDSAQVARVHIESWQTTYRGILSDEVIDKLDVAQRSAFWLDFINEAAADKAARCRR